MLKEHLSGKKKYPIKKKHIRIRWVQLFSVLFDLYCIQCAGFGSPTSVMVKNGEMGVKNSDIGVILSYLDPRLIKFYLWASKVNHWTSDFFFFWGGVALWDCTTCLCKSWHQRGNISKYGANRRTLLPAAQDRNQKGERVKPFKAYFLHLTRDGYNTEQHRPILLVAKALLGTVRLKIHVFFFFFLFRLPNTQQPPTVPPRSASRSHF